jgi:hypothetical protein
MEFPSIYKPRVTAQEKFLKGRCPHCPTRRRRRIDDQKWDCCFYKNEISPKEYRKIGYCMVARMNYEIKELKNCQPENCPLYQRIKVKEEKAKKTKVLNRSL